MATPNAGNIFFWAQGSMKLLDPADCYGNTVFCDDIRQEMGRKYSFIGVYTEKMLIHGDFPCLLPRFAMFATCIQQHRSMRAIDKFVVFLPGQEEDVPPAVELPYPQDVMQTNLDLARKSDMPFGAITVLAHIVLSPLILAVPGRIRVRAVRGDEMIRCGTLPVEHSPNSPSE
jgi:hypothetical protein